MGIIALVRNVLLRPYILPLMHMEGAACDIAMYMMGVLMLVQPVSSVSLTNIVGVLRGGGDVRYAMLCDVGPLYAVCRRWRRSRRSCGSSTSGMCTRSCPSM